MSAESATLAREYFSTGTLAGLPDRHFIDGQWQKASTGNRLEVADPGTARIFHHIDAGDANLVDAAVMAAQRSLHGEWQRAVPSARSAILYRAARLIREAAPRLAVVESLDVGKPLQEAESDIAGVIRCFEYYAGAADKLEGKTLPLGRGHLGYTLNEPVGVTAHILPWNYPLSTLARSLAPALAAGCTAVVKPAEQTSLTALMLAHILHQAGLPPGAANVVIGTGPEVGAPLVAHPDVNHITFTGSVETGVSVMESAARNVATVILELGGKSPVVVLADADLDAAADGVIGAIFENAGQICSAGSRLVVTRSVHRNILDRLCDRAKMLRPGHGLRRPTLGAINSLEQLGKIESHVRGCMERGVAVATGGNVCTDPETGEGWFFEPTILDDVPRGDPVAKEEIFGPVLVVEVIDDEEEALAVANDTPFGLVAGIYTKDFDAAHRLARDIEAGQIFINEYFAGGIEAPFGGTKKSGFGREKGFDALKNYSRVKTVVARVGTR